MYDDRRLTVRTIKRQVDMKKDKIRRMIVEDLEESKSNGTVFSIWKFLIEKNIYFEKSLSDNSESSTFYKNVFNHTSCLAAQTLWLWFLFQMKE